MSRLFQFSLLFLLFVSPLCLQGNQESPGRDAPQPLRIVIDDNYPPFCFRDSEGKLQGILVDKWMLWSRRTSIPVQLHGMDWGEALDRMRAGEFDVIDTVFRTKDREQWLEFSNPHTRIDVAVFFRKEIPGISDLDSVRGFRVSAKAGDAAIDLLHEHGVKAITLLPNYENVIQEAAKREVHVFIMDVPPALYFLHKYEEAQHFVHTEPVSTGWFHRGYPKGDAHWRTLVERGFTGISLAEMEGIDRRWLGIPLLQTQTLPRWLPKLLWVLITIIVLLAIWGAVLRWQVRLRTAALHQSEQEMRDALDFMPTPIGIADQVGTIRFVNRSFTASFGYSRNDIPDINTWTQVAYPDAHYREIAQGQWQNDCTQAIDNNQATPVRLYRIQAKNGSQHEVQICMRPQGRLLLTSFVDVTETRRLLTELTLSEARYRALHDGLQDGFARVSMEGRILETNGAFQALTGYSEAELLRMRYQELTPEKWRVYEDTIVREQTLSRGYSEVYEKEYRRKDATLIPVELRTHLNRDKDGKPMEMWAIVRDQSTQKRMEAQLLQAQKMEAVGQLAGGIAHDFNNLLAAMMLQTSMLCECDENLSELSRKGLLEVRRSLDRAAELTRQLLDFSRRHPAEMTALDMDDLLRHFNKLAARTLGPNIEVHYSSPGGLPLIMGNRGMLEQAFMNLSINARDAMPNGGVLTIEAVAEAAQPNTAIDPQPGSGPLGSLLLRITDTGAGIAPEIIDRIFEPFFTTKAPGQGTGLGLAMVFGIIKQHAGWIEVSSQPGRGSSFLIRLPLQEIVTPTPIPSAPNHRQEGHGERILLVEDEASVRNIIGTSLRRLGYTIETAENSAQALKLWSREEGRFDLLLTDVIMPGGMDGLELATKLREFNPKLPVIVSSGFHRDNEVPGLTATNCIKLQKPYNLEKLAASVASLLHSR